RAPALDRRRARRSSSSCRRRVVFDRAFPFSRRCTAQPWTDVAAPPDDLYFRRNDHTGLRRGQSTAAGQVPPKRAWRTMMMQAIRGRAGSIIVKVLFGLLIISFGFWGVYTRSD